MTHHSYPAKRRTWLRRIIWIALLVVIGLAVAGAIVWREYSNALKPLDSGGQPREVTIESGLSVFEIGKKLENEGIIRKAWAFQRYVQINQGGGYLQAGSYTLSPSESVQQIVTQLTHGKVASSLVTILPGQRLEQIKRSLVTQGFSEADVEAALEPSQYENLPVLADKPKGNSLEGYLYPDSFERSNGSTAKQIIEQSLAQMDKHLTPEVKAGFAEQQLTTYQGIILASIVAKEVVTQHDRDQAAQVFISRARIGMPLGSDVTAFYGSELAGQGQDVTYDTPYNTRIHQGFPPSPISNVDASVLKAVSNPANTDWLFFVSGDDGVTYFSKTVQEHEELARKHCIKLCQ